MFLDSSAATHEQLSEAEMLFDVFVKSLDTKPCGFVKILMKFSMYVDIILGTIFRMASVPLLSIDPD